MADVIREKLFERLHDELPHCVAVRLTLWVKVEKDWRKNFWILKKLGYA
jgi:GTPase Era involved in 16S rRNA processing